ncbi:MAG: FtsX-like permease family protein [Alphaproteobacteria bacterium]|nr:FtsX-like permease family protein [Alphaproteobacteria bacterium]MBQ6012020.1 FtsX-like permease family protein [Alphaproteobacteria bacterium]
MKKNALVFSVVREQSVFMTVVISVLTFLSVLALGIALSIGTGVIRWNMGWEKYATVQIMTPDNTMSIKKIFEENANKIESVNEISKPEMERMMKSWVSGGAKISNYLPQMFEIKLKDAKDMKIIGEKIGGKAKFIPHSAALKNSVSAGWKLVSITVFVMLLMLVSIGVCVSCISRNIAMLHKHELEILNQVGATDNFIAKQMQIIVAKISALACLIGFIIAMPILELILSTAHSARVGLLATLTLSAIDVIILFALPIFIVMFSVYLTKKTTLKLLAGK